MRPACVCVGRGVGAELLRREHRAALVLVGGVAHETGEVADEERHIVAEVLELAQLAHRQRVAERQVDRGGVVAAVDAERAVFTEASAQLALHVVAGVLIAELGAAHEHGHLLLDRRHVALPGGGRHAKYARVAATSCSICATSASMPSNLRSSRSRSSSSMRTTSP